VERLQQGVSGMSRLTEIMDNHKHLEDLFAIIRHYGMSAEFVTDSLIVQLEHMGSSEEEGEEEGSETDKEYAQDMLEDLKQFYSLF
jgi:hypothetical protein